ncbi:MAG: RNA-binding S4 domain-containing protein [Rhodocyclaceae bacterium]|nr:RNA-binding S4 domain-containing protein [Rhodocyclaceae bacterium]MCA3083691.1 RNA-binding S4 domain-containing protein [Rhodocyclaceae bacterium]
MKTIEIPLTHPSLDYIELNHLLKVVGFADSGGAGGALVTTGVVKVDGQIELRKRNKIRPGQVVEIGDTEIRVLPNPAGLVPAEAVKAKAKPTSKPPSKPHAPGPAQRRRPRGGGKPKTTAK